MATHVVLVALVVIRFWPTIGRTDAGLRSGEEALSILSYNLPDGSVSAKQIRPALYWMADREMPDVLGLQEAYVYHRPDGTMERARRDVQMLADSTEYVSLVDPGSGRRVTRVPIFTRIPVEEVRRVHVRDDGEGDGPRGMRAVLRWHGRRLIIYNVHLETYGSDKPWLEERYHFLHPKFWYKYLLQYRRAIRERAEQAVLLAEIIRSEVDPVVVIGDFNSTSQNWDVRRFAEGLQDAFEVAGKGWGATYHARFPFARIDFILASPELRVISARVPNERLSDHRPVAARLAWRELGG